MRYDMEHAGGVVRLVRVAYVPLPSPRIVGRAGSKAEAVNLARRHCYGGDEVVLVSGRAEIVCRGNQTTEWRI